MEEIISYRNGKPHQIIFLTDGIFDFVEPYEKKHHSQYLETAKKINL